MKTVIVSADEIKKSLKGYDPSKVEKFHSESAKIADKNFSKYLNNGDFEKVFLLCGGTASGKTELVSEYLINKKSAIVFDGTLSSIEGAKIKIKSVKKKGKKVVVCLVFPESYKDSMFAFLNRERKFDEKYFYKTHTGSLKTALWIAENYKEVEIEIYESFYDGLKNMKFNQYTFSSRKSLIEFLKTKQYTKEDILNEIIL